MAHLNVTSCLKTFSDLDLTLIGAPSLPVSKCVASSTVFLEHCVSNFATACITVFCAYLFSCQSPQPDRIFAP